MSKQPSTSPRWVLGMKSKMPFGQMRNDDLGLGDPEDRPRSGDPPLRFPITSHGYDRAIVDQRFAELEQELSELDRELAKLEASTPRRTENAVESDRIGKQVSSILIAAHESAAETKRLADAEAQRRIAVADSQVGALSDDADRELKRLQDETESLRRERDRLIYDIRALADALRTLAGNPPEDRPAEPLSNARAPQTGKDAPGKLTDP